MSDSDVEGVLRGYEIELPAKHGRRNRYKAIRGRRIRITFDLWRDDDYYIWTVTADEVFRSIMIHDLKEIDWDGRPAIPWYLRFAETPS